jgi:PhnB protein
MSKQPSDYPAFSPYLSVKDADRAIAFYRDAFGADERMRLTNSSDGKIGHAELTMHGSLVMVAEENPQWGNKAPGTLGGTPVTFCLIVDDADAAFERAVNAGATVLMPMADQFYGFRSGSLVDPFGHQWMIQHETEKVSPEEMQKRWDAMSGECSGAQPA